MMETARRCFVEHFADRPVPDEVASRLIRGHRWDGAKLVVEVSLAPVGGGESGLHQDLSEPQPTVLVRIEVSGPDSAATLRELAEIPW